MDENKQECSKFQGVLLDVVKTKLNLMLSEVCQLSTQGESLDFENNQVLIKTVLKKIANQQIKSVHISAEEADGFIAIFNEFDSHVEKEKKDKSHFAEPESDDESRESIYQSSPFK